MAQALPAIGAAVASTAAGAVASSLLNKSKGPNLEAVDNKEVRPNDEAALRNAQDMARRRRGVAANLLSDGTTSTSGAVASKTLLGQ